MCGVALEYVTERLLGEDELLVDVDLGSLLLFDENEELDVTPTPALIGDRDDEE